MSQITFHIIYPDDRIVTEKTIRTWYQDAVDNDECDEIDSYDASPYDMAAALEDAGLITVKNDEA